MSDGAMRRRQALGVLGALAAGAAGVSLAHRAQARGAREPGMPGSPEAAGGAHAKGPEPLFRVSLAQWSLNRALFGGRLTHLDFPKIARREFDLEGVEYVNAFFKDKAGDAAYLAEMNRVCAGEGVTQLLIMCDGEGDLGDPDDAARARAVDNHRRWADAARTLGCHSIRVNAHSRGAREEQARLVADGLRRLTEHCAGAGLSCIVENHGGLSSDAAWLTDVMRRVDHLRCGTLPDFGNFGKAGGGSFDRYEGVRLMMPFAKAVSAKSYDFNERGEETTIDYARMLGVVLDAGYRGWIGVEYEGNRMPEAEGVRATRDLLLRLRAERASAPATPGATATPGAAGTPPR
jgi:sugar phosphate isomerase/epimerase